LTYFPVTDVQSGEVLGRVVDFTTEGFRLLCNEVIDPDRRFDLRMELPISVQGASEVVCRAQSIWCGRDINPEYFAAGFAIEPLSLPDRRRLEHLQLCHCFQD